jgi:hypothetical protein
MPKQIAWLTTIGVALCVATATLSADKVRLRNGQSVTGSFLSGDAKVVRLLLANGQVAQFPIDDVAGVDFTPKPPAAPPPPAAKPPEPAATPKPIQIPQGTMLTVRLTEDIDADSAKVGTKYKAILDDPVMMSGRVVIPRNAAVQIQVTNVQNAGKMKGADAVALKANTIAWAGTSYDIVTAQVESKGEGEGKKTTRKIGGGAGLGAAIGGIAGGGKGAAIGALAGAGAGAVMAASGTEHLKLPAESLVQFQLSAAVTVRP